jgi:NitT/TauT family transport system substrate-binding protein
MRAVRLSALLICSVAWIGCRQENGTPNNGGGQVTSKPFVVAIPTYPGFSLPYLAKQKDLFHGVTVELKRIDDAAAINAGLIRGDIDACFTSAYAFVLASSQGVEAQAVLTSDESRGADGIVTKPEISSVADLKGKKVAANLGWPGHFFLLYNLEKSGIPYSDVPITNMDADKAGAAFVSGDLDAAVTWEPWLSKATTVASGKILVSTSTMPGVIVDVMLVRAQTIKERPQAVQAFVDGYFRALALYESDPASSTKIMADAIGLAPDEFQAMTSGFRFISANETAKLLEPDQGAIAKLFSTAANIWLKAGVIDKNVSPNGRVTDQFVRSSSEGK